MSERRRIHLKLLITCIYLTVCASVIGWFGYYPPTTLSLIIKGPKYSVYNLKTYSAAYGMMGSQNSSVKNTDGFAHVEFSMPDTKTDSVVLALGNKPGDVLIKQISLEGLFSSHVWHPEDIMRDFLPNESLSTASLTDDGLLIHKGTAKTALVSNSTSFSKELGRTSQGRFYIFLILTAYLALLFLTVSNPYRFAVYAAAALMLLVYIGIISGINNITPLLFFCLFAVSAVELFFYRKDFILVIASLMFAFFLIEVAFLSYESLKPTAPKKTYGYLSDQWLLQDARLNVKPAPSSRQVASAVIGDSYIFKDVVYTTDSHGRRYCPPAENPDKHALFFGGSFTWGQGLYDYETLPYQFQVMAGGEYQSYNYGFEGYGASHMYHILRSGKRLNDVGQKEGIAVYNFIGEHVYRTTPQLDMSRRNDPVFRLDEECNLEGPFKIYEKKGLKLWRRLFGMPDGLLTKASPFARFFFKRCPLGPISRDESIEITAKVIAESARLYKERFDGDFYVIIYDDEPLTDEERSELVTMLEDSGIKVLDVPPMANPADEYIHPLDRHPSKEKHEWTAAYLLDEIARQDNTGVTTDYVE